MALRNKLQFSRGPKGEISYNAPIVQPITSRTAMSFEFLLFECLSDKDAENTEHAW